MKITFVKIVQAQFQFLIDDFAFALSSATESPRGNEWEGDVQYISNTAWININCTRGEIPSLWMSRTQDDKKFALPIQVIYEYMILREDEKKIILSVSEGRQAASLLNKKQLSQMIPQSESIEERITLRLRSYARYLHENATPLLKGDFSQWLAIWEYHVQKLTVDHVRAGRSEFVPVVATDDKGQLKVIGKKAVFKDSLDYIDELKGEQNSKSPNSPQK